MKNILIGLVLAVSVMFSTTVFAFETGDMVEIVNGSDEGLVVTVKEIYEHEEGKIVYVVYGMDNSIRYFGLFNEEDLRLVE